MVKAADGTQKEQNRRDAEVARCRAEVDEIDERFVALMAERKAIVEEIEALQGGNGTDGDRQMEIANSMAEAAERHGVDLRRALAVTTALMVQW